MLVVKFGFADIDRDTYTLSLKVYKNLIESKPKGFFQGLLSCRLAGLPINLEAIENIAN